MLEWLPIVAAVVLPGIGAYVGVKVALGTMEVKLHFLRRDLDEVRADVRTLKGDHG